MVMIYHTDHQSWVSERHIIYIWFIEIIIREGLNRGRHVCCGWWNVHHHYQITVILVGSDGRLIMSDTKI